MSNSKDKVAFNIILPQNPQFFVPVNKKTEFHQQTTLVCRRRPMGCSVAENGKGAKNELWNHIVPAIQTLYTYIQKKTAQEVIRRWGTKSMTKALAKAKFQNKV